VRVLFASTRGAGHFNPLVPFANAFLRAGHEVLVAGPSTLAGAVQNAGFEFWQFDPPPDDELDEVWSHVRTRSPEEANEVVVGQLFGRLNTTAALPRLRKACEQWRPALAAEQHGIQHARVAIGLGSVEELGLGIVDGFVDAEMLRRSPYLSVFPASLDEGEQPETHRFHDPAWDQPASELPDGWGGTDAPLVYVTFGSVAGRVRVLLTVGRELDPEALGRAPDNVHVEPWVPQQDVLGHAAAVVCHGGSGSTLGALSAGLPTVVVPLFADQPENARRVAEVGAGLAVTPDASSIREAVRQVLEEPSYREAAQGLAAEMRAQPAVDHAVPLFEGFGRS
jgi:UDP:flavonoid glycosyltransferase YjiC (YdhE family)